MYVAKLEYIRYNCGVHYYGSISFHTKDEYIDERLTNILTQSEAIQFNKDDRTDFHYKGMESIRFITKEKLIKYAIDFAEKDDRIGLLVDWGDYLNPGVVLYAHDKELFDILEPIGKRMEELYEISNDPFSEPELKQEAARLDNTWQKTVQQFKLTRDTQ